MQGPVLSDEVLPFTCSVGKWLDLFCSDSVRTGTCVCVCLCVCVFESLPQQLPAEEGGRELVHCTLSQ